MAASRARRRLPISLICAQLRDHIRDLDCSPGRLGAAIDFILETARAGLVFVVEAQDRVDHRNAVVDGNSLQRVRHRPAQIVRMIRFAFKDHADGDNGVAAALLHRELAHNQRNFERARNLEQRGRDAGNQSAQLRNEVIDQPLHIGGVELAGYDREMSFGGAKNGRARGNQIRHGLLILQQARLGKTSNPQSWSPAALRALALFGTSRRKVGSRQRLDPQSRSPAALRALALLGTSRRKVGCRQRLDPQSRSPAALRAFALFGTSRRKVGSRQRLDPRSRSPAALRALALLGTSRRKVGSRQRLDPQSRSPAALRALALFGTSRRKVGSRQRLDPQSRSPAALRALALFGTSRRKVGSRQRLDPQSRSPAALRALALLGTSRRKVGCRQRLDPQSRSPAALRALALFGTSRRKVGSRQRLDPQSRSPAALRALALLGTSRRKVGCRQRLDPQSRSPAALRALALFGTSRRKVGSRQRLDPQSRSPAALRALALLGTSRRKVGSRQRLDPQSRSPAALRALALLGTSRRKVGCRQRRAIMPASELEMRESFLRERLASVDLGVFAFRAAHAYANEDIAFQNVKRSTHAIRCPISGIADALDFFRWPSLFLILFAQTLPLFLIALFLFHFAFVAAECVYPKIFRITRLGRCRIALRHREADRLVEGLRVIETLRDPETAVGLFARFYVLDRRALNGLDFFGRN